MRERYSQNDIKNIIDNSQIVYDQKTINMLQKCPATTILVERSFSMLNNLLAKDRIFRRENIAKYLKAKMNKL